MNRGVLAAAAFAAILLGAHEVYAQGLGQQICIFGICFGGGGGNHPAPAPLLAAGIPAFTALGGGVLVSRLYRKIKGRA